MTWRLMVGVALVSVLAGAADPEHKLDVPLEWTGDDGQLVLDSASFELDPGQPSDCDFPSNLECNTAFLTPPNLKKGERPSQVLRTKFDAYIVEAANSMGVHPSLLKAQLHAETTMNPLLENQSEKANPIPAYKFGKGLGQFGANNAKDFGLDWSAPKPKNEEALKQMCDQLPSPEESKKLQPIWCPRAAIWAKAKYIRQRLDQPEYLEVSIKGRENQKTLARIDHLYKRSDVESARYMAGIFNRGNMPINSIKEHYRQTGKLPRYYGVAWATPRLADTLPKKTFPLLNKEFINLCHVHKIAGLCGDKPQGWFKEYSNDFKYDDKNGWQAIYV